MKIILEGEEAETYITIKKSDCLHRLLIDLKDIRNLMDNIGAKYFPTTETLHGQHIKNIIEKIDTTLDVIEWDNVAIQLAQLSTKIR